MLSLSFKVKDFVCIEGIGVNIWMESTQVTPLNCQPFTYALESVKLELLRITSSQKIITTQSNSILII